MTTLTIPAITPRSVASIPDPKQPDVSWRMAALARCRSATGTYGAATARTPGLAERPWQDIASGRRDGWAGRQPRARR